MATFQEKAEFVIGLSGKADATKKAIERSDQRSRVLDELVGSGLDSAREEIRDAMTFKVQTKDGKGEVQSMDERGQRKSIETEDASTRYQSMSMEDAVKATNALKRVIKLKEQMLAAKDGEGKPLFTATDIINELFTPLVREGLMPENLVIDKHSEVAEGLKAVIGSYKEMLKQQIEDKRQQEATAQSNYHGAGTRTEMLSALGSKASGFMNAQLGLVADKAGLTPEELQRAASIGTKSLTVITSGVGVVTSATKLQSTIDGDVSSTPLSQKIVAPTVNLDGPFKVLRDLLPQEMQNPILESVLEEVREKLFTTEGELQSYLQQHVDELVSVLKKFAKLMESDGVTIASDVVSVLKESIGGSLDMAGTGSDYSSLDFDLGVRRAQLRSGLRALALQGDAALSRALLPYSVPGATALSGAFTQAFEVDATFKLIEDAVGSKPSTRPQAADVIEAVVKAMSSAILKVDSSFDKAAKTAGEKFKTLTSSEVSRIGKRFTTGHVDDGESLFLPLVELIGQAAGVTFSEPAFTDLLQSDEVLQRVEKQAKEGEKDLEEELAAADEEIEAFERKLVLVDEGGMEMARQQSLDVLIEQLKKDQLDLEIVTKVGSLLSGVGGSVTKLGVDSRNKVLGVALDQSASATKTVATKVGESLVPALEAAQLVMKMSVTIVKIARRAELASKFKADVDKAHKAGSMLLPSIENFYSAKVQQQVNAGVELALQIVQLAGAICSSVPEPITMAVGRLLSAIGKAGEATRDLGKTAHDEKKLREGWKVTLQALNNPANRRAGLQSLRNNSTLAVHSIAWAATEKKDPMAMEIMRSCNVDAQTLADEGTDKDKVIDYLETLLNEDLQFKDTGKLKIEWAPNPLKLSFAGWFTLKRRAKEAVPPLSDDASVDIDAAFKDLDKFGTLESWYAHYTEWEPAKFDERALSAQQLEKALKAWKPMTRDRLPHDEMASMVEQLAALATTWHDEVLLLKAEVT